MKRLTAILLALMLLLCGCDANPPEQTLPPEPSTQATTAPTEAPTEPVPQETEPAVQPVPPETLPEIIPEAYDWNAHRLTLTEAGTMPHAGNLRIMDIPVLATYEGEEIFYELLSYNGESHFDRLFSDFTYLGEGLCVVYSAVEGQPSPLCELVNVNTGEVLISDSAADIEPLNRRFFLVRYGTSSDGCAKVYDLETAQYVQNLLLETPANVFVCGTTLCVERDWNVYDLYLSDGSVISHVENLFLTDMLLLQYTASVCRVFTCDLRFVAEYKNASPIPEGSAYSSRYLAVGGEDGAYGVMDMNGNAVLPAVYHGITSATGDYFVINERLDENGNPYRGLVYADGTVLVPFAYREISVQESSPLLMFRLYDHLNSKSIFLPGLGCLEVKDFNTSCSVHHAYLYHGDYNNIKILIYNSFETLLLRNPYYIYDYLVYAENRITEVLTGETLLSGYFKRVYCSAEYLYTLQDDTWSCYRIQIN